MGAAGVLPAGPRMAHQYGIAQAYGRDRGHHLRNEFLEAIPAFLAPQRWTHHQQGIRPPRAALARTAAAGISRGYVRLYFGGGAALGRTGLPGGRFPVPASYHL